MKKAFCILTSAFIALSFSACGGSPAPETEKAAELRAQYEFYGDSVEQIISGIDITAEQADEVFLILVDCGLNGAIRDVYKNNLKENTYSYYWEGSGDTNDIVMDNGVISEVLHLSTVLYPSAPEPMEEPSVESEAADIEAAELAKTVAALMDEQLIGFVENSQEAIVILQEGVSLLEESNDTVALYALADTAATTQESLLSSVGSVRDKDNHDYVMAVQEYIVNGQLVCEKLKAYLDGGSLENLTDINTRLTAAQSYYEDITTARRDYLSNQGFTNEEITEILEEQNPSATAE